MKRGYLISTIILTCLVLPLISSVCTLTLDSNDYVEGEIVDVDGICSANNERNQAYTINWTNSTGSQLEIDNGITPSQKNTLFSETFTIPSGYVATYGSGLNVTINGTELEGTDNSTISTSGANDLIITDVVISSSFLVGKFGALDFKVTDSSGNAVSNAQCIIDIVDENDLPLAPAGGKIPVPSQGDGKVLYSLFFDETFVEEGKSYKWDMACACFNTTDSTSSAIGVCNDGSNGNRIKDFKDGETQFPFTMDSWLTVNTVTEKSEYIPRQSIFICANVTNNRTTRTPLHIFHQVRCSSEIDNDNDLDRTLIISDGTDYDERGINANTTQMQCKEFIIPEIRHLEGKSSECTASTTTWVMNENNEKVKGYTTTSSTFNITSDTINLPADWNEISENKFLAVINLSALEYTDWSGIGIGNIDIFLNSLKGESFDPRTTRSLPQIDFSSFLITRQIKEIIVWNITEQITSRLEFLEDGHLEIEIPDQDMSSNGWYNITIEFEDFEERRTEALEGIENKTGTFHLDIDCPTFATISESMRCQINAYVEDSQLVEKEVDFTCYISEDGQRLSALNFNKMITRTNQNISKEFLIPSTFSDGTEHVLQCHANYYNLGSRQDSFYDAFISLERPPQGTRGVAVEDKPFIDKVKDGLGKIIDTGEVIKDKLFSTPLRIIFTIVGGFIFMFLIILIIVLVFKKEKREIS